MTREEFNRESAEHLGALKGIEEVIPVCDKPCSSHDAWSKARTHEAKLLTCVAQYVGNGMSKDIAAEVSKTLQNNKQVGQPVVVPLPGGRFLHLTRKAISDWAFRVVLVATITWWASGSRLDKATLRALILDELRAGAKTEAVSP